MIRTVRPGLLACGAVLALGLTACSSDSSTVTAPTSAATTTAPTIAAPTTAQTSAASAADTAPGTASTSGSPTASAMPPVGDSSLEIDVEVGSNGKPVGGVKTVEVPQGQTFSLVVTSAVADEVHLHGYDKHVDVAAGGTATITQKATIPGEVIAELEGSGTTLVRIRTQ